MLLREKKSVVVIKTIFAVEAAVNPAANIRAGHNSAANIPEVDMIPASFSFFLN
jgi:hypothetical protein